MFVKFIILTLLCCSLVGCLGDHHTNIKVEGADRPTFTFSGGGWLSRFTVRDVSGVASTQAKDDLLWEIEAEKGNMEGRHVADIGTIQYGIVPVGYRQIQPARDIIAPPLRERTYMAFATTVGTVPSRVVFKIDQGKAVLIDD